MKEGSPLYASQLAGTVGKLFPESNDNKIRVQESPTAHSLPPMPPTMKPPPVASLLNPAASPKVPDKFTQSPYFNSSKRAGLPKDDTELAIELFGQDAKPAADIPNKGSTLPSQRILVDLIVESDKLKHVEPAAAPPEVLDSE
jgi:hypothetical protein